VIGIGVVIVAGGSGAAMAATSNSGPARRLATVVAGSVTQTIESSGVVTSSVKVTPSFASSGMVTSVDVAVGDAVSKGQRLAQLDTTSLQATVDSAKSTLATAQQRLQSDETGQTSAASGSSGTGSSGTGSSGSGSSGNGLAATTASALTASATSQRVATAVLTAYVVDLDAPTGATSGGTDIGSLVAQVQAAQQAVVSAQQQLDAGQAAIDSAQQTLDSDVTNNTTLRDAQTSNCDATEGSTVSADCATAMTAYQASADTLATDMAALDAKITAQDSTVHALDQAITSLDGLVTQLENAAKAAGGGSSGGGTGGGGTTSGSGGSKGSASTGRGSTGGGTGAQSSTGGTGANSSTQNSRGSGSTGSTGSSSTGSAPASAAQIAADQAAIDAAQAQVSLAEQNLAAATLTSPVSGTVAAVGLTAGRSSSGETITIIGTGLQGVVVAVPLTQIDQVKVGQPATVTVDGQTTPLRATVQSIGVVSSTTGGRTTFPVTVQFVAGSPHIYDGTGADVVITTGTATGVLTVPVSAIHTVATGRHTVSVVNGSSTQTVAVTLGAIGNGTVQVSSGLKAGQQVVLADLGQALPSSTTSTTGTVRFGQFGVTGFGRAVGGTTGTTRTGG
jgi:multidrug efflux pump subunit AcrA (membrane-fusion protein)